jgi:hypothetical protein
VAAATTSERTIRAKEACIAKARTFDTHALPGTLVGAVLLASFAAIASVALALPHAATGAMMMAILRTRFARQQAQAGSFAEAVHCLRSSHWGCGLQLYGQHLVHGMHLATVYTFEACGALTRAPEAETRPGAIVRASLVRTTVAKETRTAHALPLDAKALAMAV